MAQSSQNTLSGGNVLSLFYVLELEFNCVCLWVMFQYELLDNMSMCLNLSAF